MKQGVDYIGVTCVFYCHDGKGNLLLHKRSQNCRDEKGRWDCGGGAMQFGETFEQTVRREIKEEYCVDIKKLQLVGINNVIRNNDGPNKLPKPLHSMFLTHLKYLKKLKSFNFL